MHIPNKDNKYLLKTKRLGLQLLKKEDIFNLENLEHDPDVRHFFPTGAHKSRQETEAMIDRFLSYYKERGLPCFIAFELGSEEFVGRCGFGILDTGEIEIGYIFHKKYWGRGYASEVVSALLAWAQDNINADYIIAYAPLDHTASLRVMEKCGMKYYKNDVDSTDNAECRFYRIMNKVTMSKFIIELKNPEITEIGVEAIIDFYRTMAIDQLQLPGLNAFVTGADSASLNVVIDTRKNGEFSSEIITLMTDFFKKHQVPWGWFITAKASADDIDKHGFNLLYETPGMYFDLSNVLPKIENGIDIKEACDDLMEWIEPLLEGFPSESGENDDVYRKLNAELLLKGEKKLRHFTIYSNNEAACSGTLFLSDDSVMLHNLATKNKFRNRGLGAALTLYMIYEAKKLGYKHCFLDSSEEGFNLYHRLGFKIYCTTSVYSKGNNNDL
jgi:ribosomal-protein-alanine N-acetyltransferase